MFRSLRARLFATHLLVGGLVLMLLGISFLLLVANNPSADRFAYERLSTIANVISTQERLRAAQQDRLQLNRLLSILGRTVDAQAFVYDADFGQLFATSTDMAGPPPESLRAASGTEAGRGSFADGSGRSWLFVIRQLPSANRLVVMAPRPTVRTLVELLRESIGPLAQAALVAFSASLLLALLLSRWVARPLRRLASASRRVAAGDYQVEPHRGGPVEVAEVWRAFDEMVSKVRAGQRAMQDFVANVSHELKTPLTSIQGFAQAIVDGTASEAEATRAAGVIHDEARRMRRLVDDLLDLARFDAGEAGLDRQAVDLRDLLSQVLVRLQLRAQQAGVSLQLEAAGLPTLVGDSDRLAQVFLNLVTNAVEHSPESGLVRVVAEHKGAWVEVAVSDTGSGIPADQLPRIFERFYQVDGARAADRSHGVGLGLAIARQIVRAHGGTLIAESRLGHGSTFRVQLPTSRPADPTIAGDIIRRS